MNDTLRLVCLATLGFSLLVLYNNWETFQQRRLDAGAPPAAATAGAPVANAPAVANGGGDDLPQATQNLRPQGRDDAPPAAATPTAAAAAAADYLARVETNWLQAAIDQNGGNLARLKLKKHLYNGEPLPLLENEARLYVAQSGLIGEPDAPNHNSAYALAAAPANNPQADFITVAASAQGGGLQLVKRYVFAQNGYVASLLLEARNTGAEAKEPLAYFQLAHDGAPPRNYSSLLPTFFGVAMYTNEDKFVKFDFDEIGDSPYPRKTNNGWLGIIQRYFAVVWLPPAGEREFFMRKASAGGARVGFIAPFGSIAPGQTKTVTARLFAGAQEQDVLGRLQDDNVAPGINLVVDYGWLTFIAVLLFDMLSFIHQYVGNWGVAIVLLTFAVKLLFYPLSSAAYRSMAKMKEEAPRLKQLQEKYANDKQRMQREMMAIYREKKINPLGGCLPILVQIPVFIALYWVLLGSVELRQAPFFLWITDLSTPDPYYILSLVMGVAMFLQTRLSPAPPDPTQALIMKLMPIGFALFSVFFPSGLVLYWAVNTILSIAQQWHITRAIAKKGKGGQ